MERDIEGPIQQSVLPGVQNSVMVPGIASVQTSLLDNSDSSKSLNRGNRVRFMVSGRRV